jgi:hypothetical protein
MGSTVSAEDGGGPSDGELAGPGIDDEAQVAALRAHMIKHETEQDGHRVIPRTSFYVHASYDIFTFSGTKSGPGIDGVYSALARDRRARKKVAAWVATQCCACEGL